MCDAYALAFYGYELATDKEKPGWVTHFGKNDEAVAWLHANVLPASKSKKGKAPKLIDQEYEIAFDGALNTFDAEVGLEPWHLHYAAVEGIALPTAVKGALPPAAKDAFCKRLARALEGEPCTIERVNTAHSRSEESYIVTPRASEIGSRLEHRIEALPSLEIDPAWRGQLEAFSKKLGLKTKPFGWLMASYLFE